MYSLEKCTSPNHHAHPDGSTCSELSGYLHLWYVLCKHKGHLSKYIQDNTCLLNELILHPVEKEAPAARYGELAFLNDSGRRQWQSGHFCWNAYFMILFPPYLPHSPFHHFFILFPKDTCLNSIVAVEQAPQIVLEIVRNWHHLKYWGGGVQIQFQGPNSFCTAVGIGTYGTSIHIAHWYHAVLPRSGWYICVWEEGIYFSPHNGRVGYSELEKT